MTVDETLDEIRAALRDERRARGLSQAELGELLGLSQDFVSDLEQGHGTKRLRRLVQALHAVGLDLRVERRGVSSRAPLHCLLDGRPVARLLDAGLGLAAVEYLEPAVAAGATRDRLSVRLPVRAAHHAAVDARAFLEGLLPEGWVRDELATRARLDREDTFGLLAAYGRDCAGAVSVVPDPGAVEPETGGVEWLTDDELVARIRDLRSAPFGVGSAPGIRISLGGVQEKLVVVRRGDQFGIPLGSTPSTHLLKPVPIGGDGTPRHPGLAEVEHFCLQLAAAMATEQPSRTKGVGFRVPATELVDIGGRRALLVERYDRRLMEGAVHRLHQEDGCQVLGVLPSAKYQRLVGDAPSLRLLADALARWGIDPVLDQRALLQMVTTTVICGNADLHAKNLSFLHDGGFRLAPMYDVVSTSVYPDVDLELGLFIGSESFLDDVRGADLIDEAVGWGLGRNAAISAVRVSAEIAAELAPAVLDRSRSTATIDEHVEVAATNVISRSQALLADLSRL